MTCNICPRKCNADRSESDNTGGFCRMPLQPVVARAALHMWEEPCISGTNGSGAIFFSGCSLKCVFCQNDKISHKSFGKTITPLRLAEIFSELEKKGAHNINLVNPTHFLFAISEAVKIYRPNIPIVYNSGGYDLGESIEKASEFVDIFLMDLKYMSHDRALKYSGAADYPQVATAAILKCRELRRTAEFYDNGMMKRGLIIRHLVLPHGLCDTRNVINWVENNAPDAVFSLMSQYTPCGDLEKFPEINRKLSVTEHRKALAMLSKSSIRNSYCQQFSSSGGQFIPAFDLQGV